MGRRRARKKLPEGLFEADIEKLDHVGRGIAHIDGKVVFIDAALPGEKVKFQYAYQRKQFDEGVAKEVLIPSDYRVEPICSHADVCGGCSLQHIDVAKQIHLKQDILLEQLRHTAQGEMPEDFEVLPPLLSEDRGYRRKARLAVKYVEKKSKVLVGFREKRNSFVADINSCEVLVEEVGARFEAIAALIESLEARSNIPQIEVAKGDDAIALIFRHLTELSARDVDLIKQFCRLHSFDMYLQSGGPDTVEKIPINSQPGAGPLEAEPAPTEQQRLHFRLANYGLNFAFHPTDFIQVNAEMNASMVDRVITLMAPQPQERILDLFCGLGNFSLPLATKCGQVLGVEGSATMVERAAENALANEVNNARFVTMDLTQSLPDLKTDPASWINESYDKVLIDPPRSGALEIVEHIDLIEAEKIIYVSCNPATLARDCKVLLGKGYKLISAGVMDMFPHTNHVESIAVFELK